MATPADQPVVFVVPIDLPEIMDAPTKRFEDPENEEEMASRREYEQRLADQGVRLLTPQFPELHPKEG